MTGLRGVAALFVIFTHYFVWCATFNWETAPPWLLELFHTSDHGMTLFFTLSGFVITYNYFDFGWDETPARSFARFAWLRFSRLYPALLLFIVLTVNPRPLANLIAYPFNAWFAVHVLNVEAWIPIKFGGVLPINGTFSVIWSISTEFMLYFMFAFAVILGHWFHRRGKTRLFLALLAVVAAILLVLAFFPASRPYLYGRLWEPMEPLTGSDWDRWFFYLSPYFRITNFALGAGAALLVLYRRKSIDKYQTRISHAAAGALLLFVALHACVTVGGYIKPLSTTLLPVTEILTALLFAVIMLDGQSNSPINRALSCRALVTVGNISYSLYLFHQFLPRLGVYHPDVVFSWTVVPRFVLNFGMSLLLAIAFAYGTWRVVERPAQKWLRSLIASRRADARVSAAVAAE